MMNEKSPWLFRTLDDIKIRKEELRKEMSAQSKQIQGHWEYLFYKSEESSTSSKMMSMMNTGIGIIDGILLGWKLYRRFSGHKSNRKNDAFDLFSLLRKKRR
ncbi:hypothetical protein [Bacteroides heparinolyticus]|uniref:hypothetical protein n=1 Tax=Prevotella heparinolytica TaxID=28113 RepID=UPI0035A0CDE3